MTITKCHFSIFCEPAVRICICCFELVWSKRGGMEKKKKSMTDDDDDYRKDEAVSAC